MTELFIDIESCLDLTYKTLHIYMTIMMIEKVIFNKQLTTYGRRYVFR